jgi:XS domain
LVNGFNYIYPSADLGFPGGKAKSTYDREGHTGVTIVQFVKTESGLKEAERLVNYFTTQNHDRKGWAHAQATRSSGDDDRNPLLVKMDDRTGEKKRIFYGYMATLSDVDEVDADTKKHFSLKSRREFDLSD